MDVGKMNKRLAIKTVTLTSADGLGGYEASRPTEITVWGSVRPLRGSERERAMAVDSTITHKIMMRYNSRLDIEDEIHYGNRVFRPHSVINVDEYDHVWEIMATEVR